MSLRKFGFKCGGKRTKTDDNETKNKKAKSKNAKLNTRSIGYDRFNSHGMGQCISVGAAQPCQLTPMAQKEKMYVKCVRFFWATGFGIRATRILKLVFRRDTKI